MRPAPTSEPPGIRSSPSPDRDAIGAPVAASQSEPPLTCRVAHDPAELEALRPAWQELQARSSADDMMLAPLWIYPWWRVYGAGTGRQLRVGLFYQEQRLVGLAPLSWRRYRYRRWLPFQRLEFLGADVDEQDGVCSDYLNLIVERGREAHVVSAFANELKRGTFGAWDELVLSGMDGAGPMPTLLASALRRTGMQCACEVTTVAPYALLPASWDDYLQALGKKRRYALVHAMRALDQWADGNVRYQRARSVSELAEGKRILLDLHGERWRAESSAGLFGSTRFAAFHDQLMPRLLDEGLLELTWLTARDVPVAVLYQMVWRNKVYFYQCGRSLKLPKNLSPGVVALGHAIRRAIESGCREFDFLAGRSFYKSQLSLHERPLVQVRAFSDSWRERLRSWCERGIASTRGIRRATRQAFG